MKINNTSTISNRRRILITGLAFSALCVAILYFTETRHITNLIKNPFYKPTASDMTNQQKEEATKNDPTTTPSPKADSQPAPGVNQSQTTDQVPVSSTSNLTITSLNQTNGSVNITTTITNPANSGVCTITFTKSGARPVTRTINTTNSTCSSSIPELEFSMIGDWQVHVDYFANNTKATAEGAITVK